MSDHRRVLVTGGCGFIGSAVIRHLIAQTDAEVVNVDKMTYAATTGSTEAVADEARYRFVRADIADAVTMQELFDEVRPDAVIHLAAETHVDRSIDGPAEFLTTNVMGTMNLLQAFRTIHPDGGDARFLHVSTDEVFGSLPLDGGAFDASTPYAPRSPYSASKASSDHLVRAWGETYGVPAIITNCSNNYGPFQFPEKLIPLVTLKAAAGDALPVYGTGENVRDWLFVEDHARAIVAALDAGQVGATYLVGGDAERSNLDVVQTICDLVDEHIADGQRRRDLIEFVADRPGHDLRYAIDTSAIRADLGWRPSLGFEDGLAATVSWYLENEAWWRPILDGTYDGGRLGAS